VAGSSSLAPSVACSLRGFFHDGTGDHIGTSKEVPISSESRQVAGILFLVLPTVMYGGVSILNLLVGTPEYMANPLRQDLCGLDMRMPEYSWF